MAKISKEEILIDTLSNVLISGAVYKKNLDDLKRLDVLKEWARDAEKEKNKCYVDLRVPAANTLRYIDSMVLAVRKTVAPEEFRNIIVNIEDDAMHEINGLLSTIRDMTGPTIANIHREILQGIENQTLKKLQENEISQDK